MVYLENKLDPQEVYIPKNEGEESGFKTPYEQGYEEGYEDGIATCEECNLQEATVVITADTQTAVPDSGYEGFSVVEVDATDYGQSKYQDGYDSGTTDGYQSG